MERKRVNNINEIFDGENLLIKDFSNLDLSDIDLSQIPMEKWEGCVFYNTNFHNTGIKFMPNKLGSAEDWKSLGDHNFGLTAYCIDMSNCDFSGNDLSYLKYEDFFVKEARREVKADGCNFRNTGVNCLKFLYDITLDESYGDYGYEFWGGHNNWPKNDLDIRTIEKNPFLNISSEKFMYVLAFYVLENGADCFGELRRIFDKDGLYHWKFDLYEDKVQKLVDDCERYIDLDKQGYFKKFYSQIKHTLSLEAKFWFFRNELRYANLKDVKIEGIPVEVLRQMVFQNNIFDNVSIDNPLSELLTFRSQHILDLFEPNEYKEFYLPGITYASWRERKANQKRISDSKITFFTKVYLELSRVCNARCEFCRNNSFDESKYDLGRIRETLDRIKKYINALVIGGGEPTLRLDDVKYLREVLKDSDIDWHMFTNGTNRDIVNDDYIMNNFKINLSRHAIKDEENATIFGVNPKKIMTAHDIERLNVNNGDVTLNATCIKGGLDSAEKIIDFIKFAKDTGCKKILIQDLQRSLSLGKNEINYDNLFVDEAVFSQVAEYLAESGFKQKRPIYATGGYVSYVFKSKDDFTISLQRYISKEELDTNWPKAIKRAFDLSIDPSGNLYENWHQKAGIVGGLEELQQ